MAVLSAITCEGCGVATHVSHSPAEAAPKICGACRAKELGSKRDRALAELAALPMEERIARIEAWIYDYRPHIPLSEMRF